MRARSRPQIATCTPSAASARALANPSPAEAPDTAARLPVNPRSTTVHAIRPVATAPMAGAIYDCVRGTCPAEFDGARVPSARPRARLQQQRLRRCRRRARGGHVLGPGPYRRVEAAVRADQPRRTGPAREHSPQRRPLLGQPTVRRGRLGDHRASLVRGVLHARGVTLVVRVALQHSRRSTRVARGLRARTPSIRLRRHRAHTADHA